MYFLELVFIDGQEMCVHKRNVNDWQMETTIINEINEVEYMCRLSSVEQRPVAQI